MTATSDDCNAMTTNLVKLHHLKNVYIILITLNIGRQIEKQLNTIPTLLYCSISKGYLLVDKTVFLTDMPETPT